MLHFPYFQKYTKLKCFFNFFKMLSKNRKQCHDLKIAYGVKGLRVTLISVISTISPWADLFYNAIRLPHNTTFNKKQQQLLVSYYLFSFLSFSFFFSLFLFFLLIQEIYKNNLLTFPSKYKSNIFINHYIQIQVVLVLNKQNM